MSLNNVIVRNFKQGGITVDQTTSQLVDGIFVPGSNTLPQSALITMEAANITENPNGGAAGYMSFCTRNLNISGFMGHSKTKWLKYSGFQFWGSPEQPPASPYVVKELVPM